MAPILLKTIGFFLIGLALIGLATGKIIAGSKGLRSNYYSRKDRPFLYYSFLLLYFVFGLFIIWHSK